MEFYESVHFIFYELTNTSALICHFLDSKANDRVFMGKPVYYWLTIL